MLIADTQCVITRFRLLLFAVWP